MKINKALLEEQSGLKKLFKQILRYTPGSIIPAAVMLLITIIFTRVFNAQEFGKYSLVLSFLLMGSMILSQWLQQAVIRFIPMLKSDKSIIQYKSAISLAIMLICTVIGFVVFISFFFFKRLYLSYQEYFISGFLFVLCNTIFVVLTSILQSEMQVSNYSKYLVLNSLFKITISLILVFCIYKSASGLILAAAISSLLLIPFLWRETKMPSITSIIKNYKSQRVWLVLKKMGSYGIPMVGWFIASNFLCISDRYIIAYFRGAGEAGIYSANYSLISGGVGLLSSTIMLAAHPFFIKVWGSTEERMVGEWLSKFIEWFIIGGTLFTGLIFIYSKDIASILLGSEFRSGHVIMPLVVLGLIFWNIGLYTHKPLEFTKKTKQMMWFVCSAAIVNICLNILLIPRFGYIIATISSVISFLLYTFLTAVTGRKIVKWNFNFKKIFLNTIIIGMCSVFLVILKQIVETKISYLVSIVIVFLGWFWLCYKVAMNFGCLSSIKKFFGIN